MKTIHKLLLLFIFTFLCSGYSQNPLYAQPVIVNDQPTKQSEEEQRPPPPLGLACSGQGGGLQIDPENPTCCVSGYVYFNGVPARDASVTVTAPNGEQLTVRTPVDGLDFLLYIGLEPIAMTDTQTVTVSLDSYTVTEEEGQSYTPQNLSSGPYQAQVSEFDEELVYRIPLELGDLDIHTDEMVTIVTTYTVTTADDVQHVDNFSTTVYVPEPSFNMSLHKPPLNVKPGDSIAIRAVITQPNGTGRIEKADTFTALSGAIQIDMVMPNQRTNSSWARKYLSPRKDHAMAYDANREQMVLFGGYTSAGEVLNDTWIRDDQTEWTQVITTTLSPPARSGHTLVYHDYYDVILLFGGQNRDGEYLDDLWSWNGTQWTRILLDTRIPSPRSHHSMAYDIERRVAVLFGGVNDTQTLSETWVLSGRNIEDSVWRLANTAVSPPSRQRHAMVYYNDGTDGMTILFGGRSSRDGTETLNDTWLWDGRSWEQQTTNGTGPLLRENHTLVVGEQAVYLFGGNNVNSKSLHDLWSWQNSAWVQIGSMSKRPSSRSSHAAAYNREQGKMFIVGGAHTDLPADYLADGWLFTPSTATWQQTDDARPDFIDWQGAAMTHEQDGQFLIFGGSTVDGEGQAKTYRWHDTGWQVLNLQQQPPARDYHQMASGEGSNILLFGGMNSQNAYFNDTWLWNGQEWRQSNPDQSPQPRIHHALTYDGTQWLLFGGRDQAGETLNDFWVYTGTTWEQRSLSNGPSAREGATLVYDAKQQGVLLFGGHHGDLYYNDLWLWNGREWQPQAPNDTAGTAPESRAYHGATYDESLEQMVISGGTNEDEKIATTWAWHGGEQRWTKYYAKPEFPLNNLTSLEYDPIQNQLVGIGAELFQADDASVRLGSMMLTHKLREEPISTMSYLVPDALYQHEVLYLRGRGAVVNESRTIQKHQWTTTSNGIVTVLGNEPDFDMRAESLPLGSQVIGYAVQDDLGNWSVQQVGEITVQESERFYFPIIMR